MRLSTATTPPPTAAPAPVAPETPSPAASQISQLTQRIAQAADEDGEGAKWKWWYFILAGVCIGGFSIWSAYTQHRIKPLGELFFAAFCIAIGIWDFQAKRKQK